MKVIYLNKKDRSALGRVSESNEKVTVSLNRASKALEIGNAISFLIVLINFIFMVYVIIKYRF